MADLSEQYELLSPDLEEATRLCRSIHQALPPQPDAGLWRVLRRLPGLILDSDPHDAAPVLNLLGHLTPLHPRPLSLWSPLLAAEDADLATCSLEHLVQLIDDGRLTLNRGLLKHFGRLAEAEIEDGDRDEETGDFTTRLAHLVDRRYGPVAGQGLQHLLTGERDARMRRLAARLLDHGGGAPTAELARRLLGDRAHEILGPFLSYTRASHLDLVGLCSSRQGLKRLSSRFGQIIAEQGEDFLRSVLATLGWRKLNQGLQVETFVPLSWPGCPPLFVHPEEVFLFDTDPAPQQGSHLHLVVARGGAPAGHGSRRKQGAQGDPVDTFRRLNIIHAELLHEILAVAPLDSEKVRRILDMMDAVVHTFDSLFGDLSDEYSILPQLWDDLRSEVTTQLADQEESGLMSPELTRLMMAFEDPENLGQVRTVHGLKRFLHQRGLKLGFDIVEKGQNPNQTVDLLLFSGEQILALGPTLRFAELEKVAEPEADPWLPHPVQLAVDGLAWQLLHGNRAWPSLDCFIFGNEVHYYIAFRNHPAFLRVDFSPPQRGGMFDLEYYGVSNFETDLHPNRELDAIQSFFQELELDVRRENTRLFVRYDKERCHSLGDLVDKLGGLLRLAPFLMDVDWTIGSLQPIPGARAKIIEAWSRRFHRSGLYPLRHILTEDRRKILVRRQAGPTGPEEEAWDGQGPYRDAFSSAPPGDLWERLRSLATGLDLPFSAADPTPDGDELPLLLLEEELLLPLRRRRRHGQLTVQEGRLGLPADKLFRPRHETEVMAALLTGELPGARKAIEMAQPLAHLDRFISGEPTGFVGRLKTERFQIPLCGGRVTAYALRDEHDVIRLGLWSLQDQLFSRRGSPRGRWQDNFSLDAGQLWALLRAANYTGTAAREDPDQVSETLDHLLRLASIPAAEMTEGLTDNRQRLAGQAAAPGRAVGRAVFGSAGRRPEDILGAILVTREVQPTDCQFLQQAEGIISTGGAVLSHAALLAIQFGKPAMVVDGDWEGDPSVPALTYRVTRYHNRPDRASGLPVCRRTVDAVFEDQMVEGDLLLLDAVRGLVRILGQDQHTIALWRGFRMLNRSAGELATTQDPRQLLELRAQLLRARHQIKKAMAGITCPEVAGFALEEILGSGLAGLRSEERAEILAQLQSNPQVADSVGSCGNRVMQRLEEQARSTLREYQEDTPKARFLFEVLGLRLAARHQAEKLMLARRVRRGAAVPPAYPADTVATRRLAQLRKELASRLHDDSMGPESPIFRHLVRRLRRLDRHLNRPTGLDLVEAGNLLSQADDQRGLLLQERLVLGSTECGLESHPQVGWKAANLGEMDRHVGPGSVPPWFAVTNTAFQTLMDGPVPGRRELSSEMRAAIGHSRTLARAIDVILTNERTDLVVKADLIRRLWQRVVLPRDLQEEVSRAFAELAGSDAEDEVFCALRSSSCDEDSESSMKAGVYDTFLFLRGAPAVLAHLRRAWAGLWSERALFCRQEHDELRQRPACGLIVQRMINSRVSGVLQTVNVAAGNFGEVVLSVGLGLGEGIVSGQVAADLVTVLKDQPPGRDPVHINYLTNDKLQQIVFDRRSGYGTRLVDTLYHQRLRPALEYTELCEVTRKALALEEVYGYPLDMEFALEDDRLWLLQARPISTIQAQMQITREQAPLQTPPAPPDGGPS